MIVRTGKEARRLDRADRDGDELEALLFLFGCGKTNAASHLVSLVQPQAK